MGVQNKNWSLCVLHLEINITLSMWTLHLKYFEFISGVIYLMVGTTEFASQMLLTAHGSFPLLLLLFEHETVLYV